jgi:hypothetical protein
VLKILVLLIATAAAIDAQSNGALTGLVSDQSGAVVPGARITLTNSATGVVSSTITNQAGVYTFPSVLIGSYELRVEASGFKSFVRTHVTVETGQTVRSDVPLEVGVTQESISVTAEAPLLQQETSVVGTQISKDMLNQLPFQLGGAMRNPIAFLRLTPGASGNSSSAGDTRITGGRALASEIFVDGVQVTYNASQSVSDIAHPPYDTIAEFRVEAVVPPAEYGRTSSGVVIMSSRSGTNQYHGNALGLFRNNVFDARRYNASIADITRQYEFSGSLGGPIWIPKLYSGRNRTFFFGNYTGFRRVSQPQGGSATIATEAMRGGDFSQNRELIYDPLTADSAGRRQQFPGNLIPASRISPFARTVNTAVPLPNAVGLANNFIGPTPNGEDSDSGFVRLDHQLGGAHRVSGNYRHQNRFRRANNGPLPVLHNIIDGPDTRNLALSHDWVAKPNLVNRVQFGFTWFQNNRRETIADIGLQVPGAFRAGFPAITFGGQGMTQLTYDSDRTPTNFNWNIHEALSWTHGKHNLKFGARYDKYLTNFRPRTNEEGTYNFSQFGTSQPQVNGTGHSYASFLLGLVNSATLAKALAQKDMSRYYAFYAQDDWKIFRKLTLNYGIRYEVQPPWFEPEGRVSIMDPDLPNPGANNFLGALAFAGEGAGRIGGKRFMLADLNNISPRFGFAYQLTSSTVIRAGYAVMYAPLIGQDLNRQGFNANISISSTDGGLTPVFQVDRGWPAGVVKVPPFIDPTVSNGTATSMIEKRRDGSGSMPMTQQWQFNLQRTIWGVLVEASYVGTMGHGITNNALVNVNQVHPDYLRYGTLLTRNIGDPAVVAAGFTRPYPGFNGTLAQSLRRFPQYLGVTTQDAPSGNSTYNALLVKSEKRFSNGLQFLVAYAFSKTLTDVAFDGTDLTGPQDTHNRRVEKSLAHTDIPNRLVFSYSYELPFGKGKRWLSGGGVTGALLGGWSVAGIHTYQAGGTIRVTTPNALPIFNGHVRPNRAEGVPIKIGPDRGDYEPLNALTGQQGDLYLNRSAFSAPDPFTFGSLGVFLPDVRGFGSRGEDLSIMKRVRLHEKWSMEFRGDFFNAFNRRNLNNPIADMTNPNFGRINGQGAARVIQLGWRTDF